MIDFEKVYGKNSDRWVGIYIGDGITEPIDTLTFRDSVTGDLEKVRVSNKVITVDSEETISLKLMNGSISYASGVVSDSTSRMCTNKVEINDATEVVLDCDSDLLITIRTYDENDNYILNYSAIQANSWAVNKYWSTTESDKFIDGFVKMPCTLLKPLDLTGCKYLRFQLRNLDNTDISVADYVGKRLIVNGTIYKFSET